MSWSGIVNSIGDVFKSVGDTFMPLAKVALPAAAAFFAPEAAGLLGVTSGLGTAAVGAGLGAAASAVTGGNPLTGAVMGGVGGYLGAPASGSIAGMDGMQTATAVQNLMDTGMTQEAAVAQVAASTGASAADITNSMAYAGGGTNFTRLTNMLPSGNMTSGLLTNILGQITGGTLGNTSTGGGLLDLATREIPGFMALNYANNNTTGVPLNQMQDVYNNLGINAPGYVNAVTNPMERQLQTGLGDLTQSLGLRGVSGSSFGDTAIGNYQGMEASTLADARAKALQGSLALQGNMASQIANVQQQNQLNKNSLYGRAFDVLGRGINPSAYGGMFQQPALA